MKTIKKILKKFDIFGVPILFRYKKRNKYLSSLGGLFFIIYCALVIFFGIYFFIPFYNRKNFSFVYYTMDLTKAEQIKLNNSETIFATGLDCIINNDFNLSNVEDILKLEVNYVINRKDKEGITYKSRQRVSTHHCSYEDFGNRFNESLDLINIERFQCLDKTDYIIEGIYTDEVFSYFEIVVSSKEDSESNFKKITEYLTANDCKLQWYYSDTTIDIDDYKNPIKTNLNSKFMQLNPILFLKMNLYFMNKYFSDDNYLIYFSDSENMTTKASFSRYEEYNLYKGNNIYGNKYKDYMLYARMYIRAETKKTEIKRKYQKLTEFYANSSSLFYGLIQVLFVIGNYINNFYSEHSLTKNIFFFKEIKQNNIDFTKKHKQIQKLIILTNPFIKLDNKYLKNKAKKEKNKIKEKLEEEKNTSKRSETTPIKSINLDSEIIEPRRILTSQWMAKTRTGKKINYNFNIFGIFISNLCCCCLTKKVSLKRDLKMKANEILNEKIDIVLFIRNLIVFEIMKQRMLNHNVNEIVKFVSRPVISLYKKEEFNYKEIYKKYCEKDFNNLYNEASELVRKPKRISKEIKLISLTNQRLKELF